LYHVKQFIETQWCTKENFMGGGNSVAHGGHWSYVFGVRCL